MGDETNKGPQLPISGILIFLAALGVTVFTQAPFKSPRPAVTEIREPYEKVSARLWQDPFRAVLDHAKSVGSGREGALSGIFGLHSPQFDYYSSSGTLPKVIQEKRGKERVTILGVMVQGAPYAEETERRIRDRYAVLSGLRRAGYVPVDAEHIEYLEVDSRRPSEHDAPQQRSQGVSLTNIIPFEYLRYIPTREEREQGKDKNLLVLLWINDAVFQAKPIAKLERLAGYLARSLTSSGPAPEFKIIGPARSGTLWAMLKETTEKERPKRFDHYSSVSLYSAMATVKEDTMLRSIPGMPSTPSMAQQFSSCGIAYRNVILSDDRLARALYGELRNRGVTGRDGIVLIAEWDTFYGRTLRRIFEEAAPPRRDGAEQIHFFSYLRGIDGMLPGDQESAKTSKPEQKGNPFDELKRLEQPTGKSQYDYVRRMAEQIEALDNDSGHRIKAIGVLGSDFYDKFLVLQALRQKFPELIFFTTDLDARLVHPEYLEWTRNLLVASSYGLSLHSSLQSEVPPFRDSYQTSLFFATLAAAKYDVSKHPLSYELHPLLFEVGRNSPVLLPTTTSRQAFNLPGSKISSVLPASASSSVIVGIVILFCALLWFTSVAAKNFMQAILQEYPVITVAVLSAVILVAVLFNSFILNSLIEEPWSFTEGISIWPSELLRLAAVACAAGFFFSIRQNLTQNCTAIAEEFALPNSVADESGRSLRAMLHQTSDLFSKERLWLFCKTCREYARYDWNPAPGRSGMDGLWQEYLLRDTPRYRVMRLLPILIIYFLLCFLIISLKPPVNPIRGPLSSVVNALIMGVSVLSSTLLVFYVFDVTRVCRRFINFASKNQLNWSDVTLTKFTLQPDGTETALREWLLLHLIAKRTEAVGKLIFYPFIVWFLLFISRTTYFDNWHTPYGLAAVISLSAIYAWSCAYTLRLSAERTRTEAVHRLKEESVKTLADETASQDIMKRIDFALKEISAIKEGAFAPFSQHPLLRALLVPFGGVGGVFVVDFLSKMNV